MNEKQVILASTKPIFETQLCVGLIQKAEVIPLTKWFFPVVGQKEATTIPDNL